MTSLNRPLSPDDPDGKRLYRKKVVGTVEHTPIRMLPGADLVRSPPRLSEPTRNIAAAGEVFDARRRAILRPACLST